MALAASPEGTDKFFHLHSIHADKKRKIDGLKVSNLGMGTLLGDIDRRVDQQYLKAIISVVKGGVNVLDSAPNFRRQKSEAVIGKALKELKEEGITRDQLVLLSKGGYLAMEEGEDPFELQVQKNYLDKKWVKPEEIVAGCHCLAPKFLKLQIEHSLENMGLASFDFFFLHNPEIQLEEKNPLEFEELLLKAFEALEEKVQKKEIHNYGITSWKGFRAKKETKYCLNLSYLLSLAEKIGGKNHHFRAIQVPINLIMLEAFKIKNQPKEEDRYQTIMEAAQELHISVFAFAPLMEGQIFHLPPRVFDKLPQESSTTLSALQVVSSHPAVVSILMGMKDPIHIKENLKLLQMPNWETEVWKKTLSL